jgi:2-polyprenyl-6-methoxyphenol hydroxylase-like FAD-dependent oxidoreductase
VGGGPTGVALALQLAQWGLPTTLVEARPDVGTGFRGEALMPSGLEALSALGLLPLPLSVRQRPLEGWSFWLERQTLFDAEEPMGAAAPCTLVDPEELLQAWSHSLRQLPAARLISGRSAVGLCESAGRIRGVRLNDGQSLEADLVVACDGRASSLRRSGGLALDSESRPIDVLWFRIGGPAGERLGTQLAGRFHTLLGAEGSLALFASACGGVQLGWPVQPGQRLELSRADWRERWRQLCPPTLAAALASTPPETIEGPLRLPVRVGLAQRWWRPGLLLLGDAAHPMSPVRAQGTSMALRDVVQASALLPAALRHTAGPEREAALDRALATLEQRRRPEIARIQRLQRQEWERGERLQHSPALRGLLTTLAPAVGPVIGGFWRRSQLELRQGQAGALNRAPATAPAMTTAAMMDSTSAAP